MEAIIPSAKQLVRNSILGVVRSIIICAVLFFVYPIYLNYLGSEIFGVWVIIGAIIAWSQLGILGIPQAIMKFVAGSSAKGDKNELIEYVSSALIMILIFSSLIMTTIILFKDILANFLRVPLSIKSQMSSLIMCAGFLVFVSFLSDYFNSILSGIGRMDLASINEIIGKIAGAAISVIFVIKGYGIWGLMIGSIVNFVFILILSFLLIVFFLGFVPFKFGKITKDKIVESISFGGALSAGAFFAVFLEPFNRFILGHFVSLSAATAYDLASRLVIQARSLLEVAFRPIAPQSSAYSVIGENEKIKMLSKYYVRIMFFLGAPLFLTIIVWAPDLIAIWLNREIQGMCYAVRIIAFAYIFSLMVTPSYYLFMGIGKKEMCFWVYFIYSILNITLVLICLFLGFVSLKWVVNALALSLILSSLYLMVMSYREFGETYLLDTKNVTLSFLSIICIFSFKYVGLVMNFQGIINILLILSSLSIYLIICYMYNLVPIDKMKLF